MCPSENCPVLSFNQGLSEAGLSAALNKGGVSGAMTLVNQSMGALWSQYGGIMKVSAAASGHTSHTEIPGHLHTYVSTQGGLSQGTGWPGDL